MSARLVRHFAATIGAFGTALLGAVFLSSALEVFAVDRSWLGLASPTGVAISVGAAGLAMTAVVVLVFWALANLDWPGGDEDPGGDDDAPQPPEDPGGEPAWWPRFEEDLAAYLRDRQPSRRERETPPVLR